MAVEPQAEVQLCRPPPAFDVLRLPVIGPLLRWRWGRLLLQSPLLAVATLILYDGFTGPQLAPENLARLRRFALNLLRANPDKGSTCGKIKRAGWDDAFLLRILSNA